MFEILITGGENTSCGRSILSYGSYLKDNLIATNNLVKITRYLNIKKLS